LADLYEGLLFSGSSAAVSLDGCFFMVLSTGAGISQKGKEMSESLSARELLRRELGLPTDLCIYIDVEDRMPESREGCCLSEAEISKIHEVFGTSTAGVSFLLAADDYRYNHPSY